ncbi:MAG: 6-bladed beta-propeller [Nitrospiria bacterium]
MKLSLIDKKRIVISILLLSLSAGCGGKKTLSEPGLVWPPPPEPPRIRFVKTISSSEDVQKKGWKEHLREFLFDESSTARLVKPYALFATRDGRLYVADSGWRKVLVFDENREQFSMLGVDGPGALAAPLGVTADNEGRVYVTDTILRKCLVYDENGKHLFSMGDLNRMERPVGIAVNNALRRVYIVDTRKHKAFVFDFEGKFLFEFGQRGTGDGEFNFPSNLFIDKAGKVYITDMNFRVQIFDADGKFLSKFGSVGTGFGQFSLPKGVGVDSKGHIYVVDSRFNNVQIFDQTGRLLLFFGEFGGRKGQFWLPAGLTIDHQDRIYIADQYNHRVNIFQYLEPEETAPPSSPAMEDKKDKPTTPDQEKANQPFRFFEQGADTPK